MPPGRVTRTISLATSNGFGANKVIERFARAGVIMGNWIPNDPTLVAQLLKISSSYSPPPPDGFISPMTWGLEDQEREQDDHVHPGYVSARDRHVLS